MSEDKTTLIEEEAAETDAEEGSADDGTIIRETDIVFDCPHCGHNLAIDYRGAGLQITCVNCGELVLVPIPSGMKIDDLDLEPGEILKQLFATRRNLQKAEALVEMLTARIDELTAERETRAAADATRAIKMEELKQLCLKQETVQGKIASLVARLYADVTPEEEAGEEAAEAGETPAS